MLDQFRGEVAELIVKTILLQYHRNGKIDSYDYARWDRLSPELRISRKQFDAVVQGVKTDFQDPSRIPLFEKDSFFEDVTNRMLVLTTQAETERVLQKLNEVFRICSQTETLPSPQAEISSPKTNDISENISQILESENPHKLKVLKDLQNRVTDVQGRYEIRKAIDLVQKSESVSPPEGTDGFDGILQNLRSEKEEVRKQTLMDIANQNRQEFLDVILKMEEETNETYLKACILRLLPNSPPARQELIHRYLTDSDFRIVANAIEALEKTGGIAALARISTFASHPDNRVRANALAALHRLGHERSFTLFEKMIHSEYSAYRDSAAYAICTLKDPHFIPLLKELLGDSEPSVREKAFHGLKFLAFQGNKEAEKGLEGVDQDLISI